MSKTRWFGAVAAVALLTGASAARAQGEAEVGEIVIKGRGLEETLPIELAKYGHDLALVPGSEIADKSYVDAASVLQFEVPGLYLAPQAGPFSYAHISLQGSRLQDVLWTVDGVRVNNRLYSTTLPTDTLPASMIERIEVLKGGESLFYGTQGVAGAINIVTRGFSDQFGGQVTVGGDTNDSVHADGYVRGPTPIGKLVAFISYDQSDGFQSFDVYQPSATMRKRGYDVMSGGLKWGFDISDDLSLSASYIHTDADLDYPNARLTNFSQNSRDEDLISAKLDYTPAEGLNFFIKAYHHDWDSRYTTINNVVGSPGSTTLIDDNLYWGFKDTGLNALAKLPLGGFDLLAGYDFQTYEARDEVLIIEQISEDVHAVFGQVRTNADFSDRLSFGAGVRHNKTGEVEATVWNASGRFDISPELYIQANGGTGFSLPTAENLFAVDPFSTFGNPFLKPEESTNINASVGGRLGGFEWQVTGFWREVDNLITFETDPALIPDEVEAHPDYSGEAYVNLGKVKFDGFELIGSAQLGDGLRFNASYTHTKAVNEGSDLQIARIPESLAKAELAWDPEASRFGGSVAAIWTGDVFQGLTEGRFNYGDYVVVDLSAHVYLDDDHHQKLTFKVQNVLDEDYAVRLNSGATDTGTPPRFSFRYLGTPQTFHVRYSYSF